MDELRFKAWDDVNKKILTGDDIEEDINIITGLSYGKLFIARNINDWEELKPLRSTGLKDKNGVEIYEGDIVRWGHIAGYTEINPRLATVEINPDIRFKTFNLGDCDHTFQFGSFIYQDTEKSLEVLGNIYENPELLTNKEL